MIKRRINDIKDRIAGLKQEHASVALELAKKKKETELLAAGSEKYNDNPKLKAQVDEIIKKRVKEVQGLMEKLNEIGREGKEIKLEMKKTFSAIKSQERKRRESVVPEAKKPMVIAASETCEKALDQALSKVQPPQPKEAARLEPVKTEVKIEKTVKKAPPQDLYDQAAQEAKAQEDYLKNQSTRSYGNA